MTMHELLTISSGMMEYDGMREEVTDTDMQDYWWHMNVVRSQEIERYHRSLLQNTRTYEQLYPGFRRNPYTLIFADYSDFFDRSYVY